MIKKIFWALLCLFSALFAISLILKNPEKVNISYYYGINFELPIYVLLLITFSAVLCFFWMLLLVFKQKMRVSSEHRKLVKVEKEVENLRALPLKDEV